MSLKDNYDPTKFEEKIYDFWNEKGFFKGKIDHNLKPFSIVIPPPNITGYLHVGHALNNSLQDIVIRYARMKGYSACWFPGTDHAGIATQNVVERELNKKGITRFDLGREKFIERVWEWRKQYGSRIIEQLKSLGSSCDWYRLRFTLDDDYVKAVNREFVTLFNAGLIYRGNYIVNWCPRCLTAISDIEVEHKEKKGFLWEIKYPLVNSKTGLPDDKEYITVATTRPETMLGDTAVAVNPKDKRYKGLIGRSVFLPLTERKIPVIADDYVDMDFGTGAVKITPAHDPNDFEMGKRHYLPELNVMDESAVMNENAGKYNGLERYEARKNILKDLESAGYLVNKKQHSASVGYCSRCDTTVEPRISTQWFVSMRSLAEPAIKAVREGRVRFVPKKWEKLYFNWMENIRDWCISRQLWWGHRIPVWFCNDCEEMIVSETPPDICNCGCKDLKQDEDVLDTWFSSCLWPFAALGWPGDTEDLAYYFPTSVLITAHDIIFFWVARMIMMSLYFKKEIPFSEVFINPLVNDKTGQKMSKSRGNVIDPMTIIEKNGADVLRYTLASLTTPGRNLLLGDEKIEGTRNFANKLWNAAKFVLSRIEESEFLSSPEDIGKIEQDLSLNIWDKWILSRLSNTIKSVEKYLEKYQISFACRTLTNFLWNDYCDWYLEAAKTRLYAKNRQNADGPIGDEDEDVSPSEKKSHSEKTTAVFILWYVMERYLRTLHPFMPFITEKIWQDIPHEGESIMISRFPGFENDILDRIDTKAESDLNLIFAIISEIRKVRSELKINPGVRVSVNINALDNSYKDIIAENSGYIIDLARLDRLKLEEPADKKGFIKTISMGNEIYIYLVDVIDVDLEIKRINDEISKIRTEKEKSSKKISNPQFLEKAPQQIIEKEKSKLNNADTALKNLQEQLEIIRSIKA